MAKPSVRPSRFYSYRLYLIPALENKRLTRPTPTDVRAFVLAKANAGLAPAIVKQMRAILRALQHAMREDLVARNVAKLVVVPGGSQSEVVAYRCKGRCAARTAELVLANSADSPQAEGELVGGCGVMFM